MILYSRSSLITLVFLVIMLVPESFSLNEKTLSGNKDSFILHTEFVILKDLIMELLCGGRAFFPDHVSAV